MQEILRLSHALNAVKSGLAEASRNLTEMIKASEDMWPEAKRLRADVETMYRCLDKDRAAYIVPRTVRVAMFVANRNAEK